MDGNEGRMRALVTGANRGIGREVARQLAAEGMDVMMVGRDAASLEAAAAELGASGLEGRLHVEVFDVGHDDAATLAARVDDELGGLDVLVNNAGIFNDRDVSLFDLDDARMMENLQVNALGAWRLMRALVPGMMRRGHGRVVNVSSQYGSLAGAAGRCAAYRTSKAALNMLTRVAADEAGPGVKINAIHPGWVRTDMGGEQAPRTVEDAAREIVALATLDENGPTGGFFAEGRAHAW